MWADEFLGWNLITDPSWSHMYGSWSQGADSGGIMFYVLGRCIVRLAGDHPAALRLFSAASLWAAGVIWFQMLKRLFSTSSALVAVLLVWFGSPLYVDHLAQVRFYGLLVLGTAIAVFAAQSVNGNNFSLGLTFWITFLGRVHAI